MVWTEFISDYEYTEYTMIIGSLSPDEQTTKNSFYFYECKAHTNAQVFSYVNLRKDVEKL